MKPEFCAAIAPIKEHPAALYEFRKTCAMHFTAALLASSSTRTEKVVVVAVQRADDLIAALGLQLEPPEAPPADEDKLEAGRIRPAEWCNPRLIVFTDSRTSEQIAAGSINGIHWGERTKDGEDLDTTADGPVFNAIERQYLAGNESGRVDVMGIVYAFQKVPDFN
jgi:hypothetical protein